MIFCAPRRARKPLDKEIEKYADLRQAVASSQIQSRQGQRLDVMYVGQQRHQYSALDWVAKDQIAKPHDSGTVERQPQRGIDIVGGDARRDFDNVDSVVRAKWPTTQGRTRDNANMVC